MVTLIGSTLAALAMGAAAPAAPVAAVPRTQPQSLPHYFEANRGQWPASQAYRAYGYGYGVELGKDGVTLRISRAAAKRIERQRAVSLRFEGANPAATLNGLNPLAAAGAWFAGGEAEWRSGIPLYGQVRLGQVYSGVDATFYSRDGQLEYDLEVAPGVSTNKMVLALDGADKAVIGKDGNLTIEVEGQTIVLHKPLAWQPAGPAKRPVDVSYELLPTTDGKAGGHGERIRLKPGAYDSAKPLTIDPVLTFATYLSSTTDTLADYYILDLALDSSNNVYVLSTDSSYSSFTVQKLTPAGTLAYTATFSSNAGNIYPTAIQIGYNGEAYIAAAATSGYPTTTTAYQASYPNSSYNGGYSGALSVLSASGATLAYSTYLGGKDSTGYGDNAYGVAVDGSGNAYLTGQAGGASFPTTTGAYQTTYTDGYPAGFLAKFNPAASGAASLVYSTLLGGQNTQVNGVAVDTSGNAFLAVYSRVCNVATTPGAFAYSGLQAGYYCGYVTEVNPAGSGLVYSAYLGPGTPVGVALDGSDDAYVAGSGIQADDFPATPGAYQTGNPDGFALELNAAGGLVYSTYLSGPTGQSSASDLYVRNVAISPGCASACPAYLSGGTTETNFPVVSGLGGPTPVLSTSYPEAFLVVLNGTGSAALTSGYLSGLNSYVDTGGDNIEPVYPSVAVDTLGNAWVAGSLYNNSGLPPDFPVTTGAAPVSEGSYLAEVGMTNAGNVIGVPNSLSFGNTVPVNVSSTAFPGSPAKINLRNMGSAAVTLSSIVSSPSVFTESDNCNGQIAAAGYCTAQIVFTPKTDAPVTGTLTIASNGVNTPLTIPLSGQGADVGFLQFSSASLSFGNQTVGTSSAAQTVTLTNIGDEQFYVLGDISISPTDGFTQANNCPNYLSPGGSCQIQVVFAPGVRQVGVQNAEMSVGAGSNDVTLSGAGVLASGVGGPIGLAFSAATLNFGTVAVGTPSSVQSGYITNTGTQVLNLPAPIITLTSSQGAAADFSVSQPSVSLLPQSQASFTVTFTPSTSALETATVNFPVAGVATSYTVLLIGQGAADTKILEFQPGNAVFTDQVVGSTSPGQTFYIFNTGDTPFLVDRVIASGDFAATNNNCAGTTLPAVPAPGYLYSSYCSVQVSFTPSQVGARAGTLTVIDAASPTPQTIPLSGNGIAATGAISLTPATLTYGTQIKGSSSAVQYVTLTNQGNNSVNFTGAATNGDYAVTYDNCTPSPYTIPSGSAGCQVGVTFTPTVTTSPDNGTLTISTSAGPQTVALTGGGEAATLSGNLWPSAINFGFYELNNTTNWVPVYIVNTGTEPLQITANSVSGNFALYSASCVTTLAAGQDCQLLVDFTPTGTGSRTGALTVKTKAATYTATLAGTGTATSAGQGTYFSPAMATFDQQAANSISAPITVNFYYGGSSTSFAFTSTSVTAGSANFQLATGAYALNTCTSSTGSGNSCQVNVVYSPSAAGLQTGTLTVGTNAGSVAITLTGYSPAVLDSGLLSPGGLSYPTQVVSTTSGVQQIFLYNTGASAFTVGTIGGTNFGPTSEFQVYSDGCSGATLSTADGQNGTRGSCYVYVQFAPSAAGNRAGVLSIPVTYADGTQGTFNANLTGLGVAQKNEALLEPSAATFPDTAVGQSSNSWAQNLYLVNSGNLPFQVGALTGANVVIQATKTGDFTAVYDGCSGQAVGVGSDCPVTLVFQPATAGARTGSVVFPVTYANSTTATSLTLTLAGNAIAANSSIALTPGSVQFGPVTAGAAVATNYLTINAVNTGNVPITFTRYALSTGFGMYLDQCTAATVAPGGSCPYWVYFNPATATAGSTITGTLSAYSNATGSPQTVAITGVSVAKTAELSYSVTAVNFGSQQASTASSQYALYLVNGGDDPVTISTVTIGGTNKSYFSKTDDCVGTTVAAFSYCPIYLTFTPGAAGSFSATINETDSLGGSRTIPLTGTGVAPYAGVELYPASLTFSSQQPVGEGSAQQYFSITNTGPSSLVIGQLTSSDAAEFPITSDSCSGQALTQNGSCLAGVLFAPSSAGAHTAHIGIPDNATGSPQLLSVSGAGVTELTSSVSVAANPASAAFGSLFTLTASVLDQNSNPLTNGSVTFYDGTTVLGSVQVVRTAAGGKAIGTATLNTILMPLGANSITAKYVGGDAVSTSAAVTVTVTGKYPTTTTFASSGSAGDYTFTGAVSGAGPVAPTGSVSFTDGTTGLVPGTAPISATTLTQTFIAAPAVTGLPAPNVVALADVNGDGIPDLVSNTTNGIEVQLGEGNGAFQAANTSAGSSLYGIAFGDFNGDGKLDIAIGGSGGVGILLGNGNSAFQQQPAYFDSGTIYEVAIGDFNGDGKLDMVAINPSYQTLDLLLGNGDGTFQPPASLALGGGNTSSLAVGDFNGDGKLDVAVSAPQGNLYSVGIFLGNGDGTFQAIKSSPTVNYYPQWVVAADVNGDGKLDLVTNDNNSYIGVLLGNGNGTFAAEQTILTGTYNGPPVLADVNGDGKLDLAVANGGADVSVSLGNGNGTFQTATLYPTGSGSYWTAVADLNHDGRADIVVANNSGNSATVLLNHVSQTATLNNAVVPGSGTHPITGTYSGDANFAASASNILQLAASLVNSTMVLAGEPSSTVQYGQALSVLVTLTGSLAFVPAPRGSVSYSIDSGTVQTAALTAGAASIPIAQLSIGAHSIAVTYGGDQYYTALTTQTLAVTVTKGSQTISFAALPAVTYGVTPITLSATASSGLAVTFALNSGPATLSGSGLTIVGAGTVSLTASQAGNADYSAATSVTQSFTVNPATLTITANNATVAANQPIPAFTYTPAGFVNGDTSSVLSGAPTETTTATDGSPAGAYPITITQGSLAATNYSFTFVNGTLTITGSTAAATPAFSLIAGTYALGQSVTITDATANSTIYYTTNGTTPTTNSTPYTGAITLTATETVEAIAVASGYSQSAVAKVAYTVDAAKPEFSLKAGTYAWGQSLTITDATPNSTIYYTTNGTSPNTNSTQYTGPITLTATETVEAIAVATGDSRSPIAEVAYTIAAATPVFSPNAGTYTYPQTVTISDATSNSTIYYTTNGTTPTTASTQYTGAITVSATETLEAIAVATGDSQSGVAEAFYTITP